LHGNSHGTSDFKLEDFQLSEWVNYDVVYATGNVFPTGDVGFPPRVFDMKKIFFSKCNSSSVLGCSWWSLFRIGGDLEKAVVHQMRTMHSWKQQYGRLKQPVVAVHIRVGDVASGMTGAPASVAVLKMLENIADNSLACVTSIAGKVGFSNATILVISDSPFVRKRLSQAQPWRVWSTEIVPAHFEKSRHRDQKARVIETMVDLLMMSISDFLVKSQSGFANLAQAIGMFSVNDVFFLRNCGVESLVDDSTQTMFSSTGVWGHNKLFY
jgi:hypothetical protein